MEPDNFLDSCLLRNLLFLLISCRVSVTWSHNQNQVNDNNNSAHSQLCKSSVCCFWSFPSPSSLHIALVAMCVYSIEPVGALSSNTFLLCVHTGGLHVGECVRSGSAWACTSMTFSHQRFVVFLLFAPLTLLSHATLTYSSFPSLLLDSSYVHRIQETSTGFVVLTSEPITSYTQCVTSLLFFSF